MTPQEKANEYLSEFSKEKSIDIAETMLCLAKELKDTYDIYFWKRVLQILNNKN